MKQKVIIQKPAKTAMQSGRAKTKLWQLFFLPDQPQTPNRLMGWPMGADTRRQVILKFATKEEAIAYADKKGYEYCIEEPQQRAPKKKSYAENFTKPVLE